MRIIYFLFLLIFLAAVGIFALQNHETVTLNYLDRNISSPISLIIASAYLLGMLSGWTVVGMFRRSLQRVTERRRD